MARQARGERARAAIIDAAIAILTDAGYSALTTRAVQAACGLSRGSLLFQFPTREDLLAAVIDELVGRRATRAQRIIDEFAARPPADRLVAAIAAVRELFSGPDFLAEMELWSAARTNPALHTSLVPLVEKIGARLREQLTELFGPEIAAHPHYPQVAMLTVELARGLAFSAPIRRGHGDRSVLEFWQAAAATMLGRSAPAESAASGPPQHQLLI
ncbi:TetR/AcrR family transcriptional regulator [Nocardia farcinica]|uniref:Putative DNA-binding transcriptional regulator n=2 Tax=Nocardia farcinica TaxID=37329 RepID=A0A0H5NG82_NOCFR|nr:TetR/AcrR family transcriptional regulator [Nocardia farcinica]AXK89089.1 TetR/AcrR family transcriptional regulator [Nocardia farcinica]MBA4856121.1 TetR/AcrR family transcriptional regulator [Nocardia farcinica]MBC9816330.1 TetR/AcrR family transcriptional regulator [Nocardia farcinica]MBF6229735.1 TetR/AcrR family transcriptional regulator [Nocardia farcinica]MBF6256556.1 TetR/AcrR family transcriptional regulator [Nocardia farcinica]